MSTVYEEERDWARRMILVALQMRSRRGRGYPRMSVGRGSGGFTSAETDRPDGAPETILAVYLVA